MKTAAVSSAFATQPEIEERVAFIGLDLRAREAIQGLQPLIAREIWPALDAFYARAREYRTTQEFFHDPSIVAHAKARQAAHWGIISSGDFDKSYEQAVRRVGETHARLGLPPRWYIGGYALVAEQLVRAILRSTELEISGPASAADAVTSLMKAVFLDMDLAISIYLEALEERRQREEQARVIAEANQTVVVRALAEALARVAEGDLSAKVEQEVSLEHQQLKDDFNSALARLVEAQRESEAASRAKSDFLSNISHEIRTPLNGVIGIAGALSATELSPQQHEMIDLIQLSAETAERLLSDVLDVSKIEAAAMRLELAPFDLQKVVEGAVELFRAKASEKGIGLGLSFSGCPGGPVVGDAVRVAQIVTNLVSNAVKFTSEGGVKVRAICHARDDGLQDVTIEVADTGIGFDPNIAAQLFDRFSQADTSITRRYGGTGLGLSICRGIAAAMGGDISASSEPEIGSRFTVRLRFPRHAEGASALPGTDLSRRRATAGADRTDHSASVLLVEDHPVNRKVARLILDPLGLEVVEAENGREALDRIRERRFDVVLMDMQMPVMDGLTATRAIRKLEAKTDLPPARLIMLTANASDDHRTAAMSAGADDHIAKPIQRERLIESVLKGVPMPAAAQ